MVHELCYETADPNEHTDMSHSRLEQPKDASLLLPSASGPPFTEPEYFLEARWQLALPLKLQRHMFCIMLQPTVFA